MEERLQKIISRGGIASRRAGEELILAGRVRVNGRIVTELGQKADLFRDTIEVDGRRLVPESPRYIVLHKPRNVVSTLSDPEGRPTVAELLREAGARLYPVGRLDFATSGVLLVTNDGEFANGLLHPRGGVPKTYVLKVKGLMTEEDLERWREGVELDDGKTLPADVHLLRHEDDKTWFEVTLREGRNQQIRRMGEATGFPVMRLARTSFAGVTSEGLRPGAWRSLTVDELLALRKEFGVPKRVRGAKLDDFSSAPDPRARRPRARPDERPPRKAHGDERPARASRSDERRASRSDERRASRSDERPARASRSDERRDERRDARPPRKAHGEERPARPGPREERPARAPAQGPREGRGPRAKSPEAGPPRGPRRR